MNLMRQSSPEHTKAYYLGQWCFQHDEPCPYTADEPGLFRAWCRGFAEAKRGWEWRQKMEREEA